MYLHEEESALAHKYFDKATPSVGYFYHSWLFGDWLSPTLGCSKRSTPIVTQHTKAVHTIRSQPALNFLPQHGSPTVSALGVLLVPSGCCKRSTLEDQGLYINSSHPHKAWPSSGSEVLTMQFQRLWEQIRLFPDYTAVWVLCILRSKVSVVVHSCHQ